MRVKRSPAKRAAEFGIMSALAIAISYLETLIPAFPGMPPGAKPGFSNIVTMFAAESFSVADAFMITVFKAVFAGVTRGATAFFMSLAGGLLSTFAACLMLRLQKIQIGYIGIGIICAVCHNAGQLAVACVISGTSALIFGYGPILLLFALATGFLTGSILKLISPALKRIKHDDR
ncbi:MAG: Gx transporter family protein [Clostridia bacterium]|nr:Gx transporter family protein [Clostridia bacterium]